MKGGFTKGKSVSFLLALALCFGLSFFNVHAADVGEELAEQFLKKTPVASFDAKLTLDEGKKAQESFIKRISREFGEPVGYKAGLTNPNVQKVFGVNEPVRGTLLKGMVLKSGSILPANFGAVPIAEGDLVVRVGDEEINQAKNPEEVLKYLDAVFPFIELPDMVFGKGVKLTGATVVAINVGARYGVIGDPLVLSPSKDWQERLKNFTLKIFDEKGEVIAEGKGDALLGDPLNAAFWIKESLVSEGKRLKKGDLLSLGSVTRPIPTRPGMTILANYIGLDPKGPVEVWVGFE
ncbi:MAG: hypothetical protein N2745_11240 [Syntrophorhabdaceae bacterium]|nr:hypothetical protein [Syntrophorhabdaceae bacterium]